MDSSGCTISNFRDFLVRLPRIARFEYDEAVSYLVWKILDLCIEHGDQNVDWLSFVELLESKSWRDGVYQQVLKGCPWKEIAVKKARNGNVHVGTMCNRQCFPAETVYYCFTCTMNPLYELCEYCFDKKKHEGHTYTAKIVVRPEGRVCHCGNTSVFKEPHCLNQCRNPQNAAKPPESGPSDSNQNVLSLVSGLIDYLIDVTVYSNEQDGKASPVECGRQKLDGVAKLQTVLTDSSGEVADSRDQVEWALQVDEEDCHMRYRDLAAKISRVLHKPAEYAISLVERLESGCSSVTIVKSFDRAKIEVISSKFASEGARNHIRATKDTFKRDLVEDLIHWFYTMMINEKTSLQSKKAVRLSILDSWRSGLSIISQSATGWCPYVAKINLLGGFLVSYEQRGIFPWFNPWSITDIEDPAVEMAMSNYNRRLVETNVVNSIVRYHPFHGSRFQYILTASADFLSRPGRYRMLKILTSLFTIVDPTRKCLAAQYLDSYLAVLYSTVASDNTGFKVSLMGTLSQYTFQDPEIANMAIESGFIQRILRFAFNLMAFTSEDLMTYLPIPLYYGCKLPGESIKNRRSIICFKDICILMSTNTIPQALLEDENILTAIIESFAEFNKVLPLKRETSEHVEFENFDFSSYYFFFSSILIMTDGYIRSVSLISDLEARRLIVIKLANLAMKKEFEVLIPFRRSNSGASSQSNDSNSSDKIDELPLVNEKICNHTSKVINYQVGVDTQNFFNPMSYLFKFVLQWSLCGRYVPLPEHARNYLDFKELFSDKSRALHISDSALSTLVLLGQINVGFWVRNGTPITHQARMYTKYSMREFTYMSDIFNVQFSMSTADPDDFMVTFLARWGLKHWANGFPMGDYPDFETTVAIVNQCFLLLIQLLTEVKSLTVVSSVDGFQKTLRAEIIHALCFKNCTYSQIMNSIPEHITKHAAFDLYLEEYTNFTPPSGLTDCGVYALKPEYRDEIDPYYVAMSPNKRYELEKNIRTSMSVKEKIDYDSTFVPAKQVIEALKATPYCDLYAITSVDTFGTFLKNTLDHIKKFECDGILPTVVHLIHLCVVNNLNGFMKVFWHEFGSLDAEFCYHHSIGSVLYDFLLNDGFSQVHGKIREIFRYLGKAAPHVDVHSFLKEQVPSYSPELLRSHSAPRIGKEGEFERKKALAKLRRKKMMRKLAKQQLQFMGNHSLLTSDDESCKELSEKSSFNRKTSRNAVEDPCVFCKMPSADDVFVYFSYQEENIREQYQNFHERSSTSAFGNKEQSHNGKVTLVQQAPVLRTCGHGSHVSCLANHMKSARNVHNQTTKNVPVAFGFGLMYCPLCNGLSNSFLPQLPRTFYLNSDTNLEGKGSTAQHNDSTLLLLSTSVKAARIFRDLIREPVDASAGLTSVISRLLANTVSNIELASRRNGKNCPREISSQKLLTLRLLLSLRDALMNHKIDHLHKGILFEWESFLSMHLNSDLLICGSELITPLSLPQTESSQIKHSDCLEYVKKLTKRKIVQDMLVLGKEMIKTKCYDCTSDEISSAIEDSEKTGSEVEKSLMLSMFGELTAVLEPGMRNLTKKPSSRAYIFQLLTQSLSTFLRRLFIMLRGYGVSPEISESSPILPETSKQLLSQFGMSNLESVLTEFQQNDFSMILDLTRMNFTCGERDNILLKLEKLRFTNSQAFQLIELPDSLSEFFSSEDENLMHRALKDDTAICLFCGEHCHIQKSIALHNYAIGACTNHVRNECPVMSVFGVFLLIRSNAVYLSYSDRGTFYPAPYLHKHGEPDEDFKYNSPVYLDLKRYEHLKNAVILENMIPHIVFRLTDNNSDLGGWETL